MAHLADCATIHGARMAPLDPGSMNMMLSGGGVDTATAFAYVNDFAFIHASLTTMARLGLGASLGIYEPGFLRAAVAFHRSGRLPAGSIAKLYFFGGRNAFDGAPCIGFGLEPSLPALEACLEIIGDSGLPWAVAVIGGCVRASGMARLAIERGGHVRMGLEDFAGDGTPSNGKLLAEIVALAADLGKPVASLRQAASDLGF